MLVTGVCHCVFMRACVPDRVLFVCVGESTKSRLVYVPARTYLVNEDFGNIQPRQRRRKCV